MNKRQQTQARTMVVLGIVQQLLTTRQAKLFGNTPLTPSQFALLNHFTHSPKRSWLVSELAEVMEMNQPGITKTVTVLLEKDLLKATQDKTDKRKRHLNITAIGLKMCEDILKSLSPDISHCLADWQDEELNRFNSDLEKLMGWLDDHREDIKYK
ncbi:MAG: MarR family winged helix-turn-helix transcriptional regulator [Bermanella sp.]